MAEKPMTQHMELGKRVLAAQPFSVLVGAELVQYTDNMVEIQIPITTQLKQQQGFVHGGVVSYAADNALTFAGGTVFGADVVTSELKINYMRPVIGSHLLARATVMHAGRNQAVCRCDVFSVAKDGERLCATAQGTISKLGQASGAKT